MTTEDQGKKDESSQTPEDRLEEVKREEKEDASDYYTQEDSKVIVDEAAEFNKPVTPVPAEQEEMNMLKAVAFLGFGMAALAIIFILFFVRDLDTRVMGMDGTVSTLEEKIAPLEKRVEDGLNKVNEDVSGLKNKLGNYERTMAVMELKRALVTVKGMSLGNTPDVATKSGEVIAGIESLLAELGTKAPSKGMPAGVVSLEEAPKSVEEPTPPAHIEESSPNEEPEAHVEEAQPDVSGEEETPVKEESTDSTKVGDDEEEESADGSEEGGDDEEEEEEDE